MDGSITMGLTMVIVLVILDAWVYLDARARAATNRPASVQLGGFVIDDPRTWLAFCIVLFVFFFPLYLVARRT